MGRTTIVIATPGKQCRSLWAPYGREACCGSKESQHATDSLISRFDPRKTGVHLFAARYNGSPRPGRPADGGGGVGPGAAADGMGSLDGRKANRSEEGPAPREGSSVADFGLDKIRSRPHHVRGYGIRSRAHAQPGEERPCGCLTNWFNNRRASSGSEQDFLFESLATR